MPLMIPTVILALGALLSALLGAAPRLRGACIIAAGVTGLALVALGWLGSQLPVAWVASSWRPLALFGAPVTFAADAGGWALAIGLVMTSLLSFLSCEVSAHRATNVDVALILAATGAGVAALFGASFITLLIAWGSTDVLLIVAMLRYGPEGTRRAGLALLNSVLAISALWAAQLLAQPDGISGFLDLARFSGPSASLFQLAVILRLGLVPLHLWRPIDLEIAPAQMIPLVVIPTLLGFDLLTYLPALTAGLPPTLFALAALTVLVGGFVAWSETEERPSLAGVVVAGTGLSVLAVANAGQQAVATAISAAVAWALGVTVFSLSPGWDRKRVWLALPSLLALLSLLGVPPTLGFITRLTVYAGLEAALPALVVALVGETFVIAALVRLWVWVEPPPLPRLRLPEALYVSVFAIAGVALFVAGLSPETFTGRAQETALLELGVLVRQGGVGGWAGWALPVVAGITLFLTGEGLRQRLEGGWRGLGALLRLEWVYGLLFAVTRWVAVLARGLAGLVEGEGALLWTTVILLIVLLYLMGNGGL